MADIAIICRNEYHARFVRSAFGDMADYITPCQVVSGRAWDKIIYLPLDDPRSDIELERTKEWLKHLRCRLRKSGEIIYL